MSNRILLVEDDPINVRFMEVVLTRKGGFQVVVTESGDEVVAIAHEGDLAAVVMDVSLSRSTYQGEKVDGLKLAKILKGDPATAGIPILLATAHAMFGDKEKFLAQTGADGYLSKPIHDPDALVKAVRDVLPA